MKIAMLGEHATGKSSYVVGLHSGLVHGIFDGIVLVDVRDPVQFLNDGLGHLSQRQPVERSNTERMHPVSLTVTLSDRVQHDLWIPDRSGEALRDSLNGREWHSGLLTEISDADGILLFVNPMKLKPGSPTGDVAALIDDVGEDDESVPEDWKPAMMPTDARMVDALQEIRVINGKRRVPVAIVISAWDVVSEMTPSAWLAQRLPLLDQFLTSAHEHYPSATFAVSVQGGRFDDADAEVDPEEPDPWDRAWAENADGVRVELAAPLAWLLRSGTPE